MPFIETAVLGSPGAGSLPDGDTINHFNGIRVRVTGSGILRPTVFSMDKVRNKVLGTISMNSTSDRVAYKLVNFMSQRCLVRLETTAIDETFQINRITIYSKPTFTSYPA